MSESTPLTPPAGEQRRLAAIVFTDVVGYSARMQRDETGTMKLVAADFTLMRERCAQHGGEVLNSMGDGLLLCFGSAVQAVACAVQIQAEFAARKSKLPPEQALEHRMGVHIGDVFRQETGGLAGDGVNIAARLEGKAPIGGVCISQMVYDTVQGKVPIQAVFVGPETFKNITNPIPIWHVSAASGPTPSRSPQVVAAKRAPRRTWMLAATLGTAAVAALAVWQPWAQPPSVPAVPKPVPAVVAPVVVSDQSVVVLSFENLSPDPENAFFTEGIHADIIAAVGRLSGVKVISRNAALHFKGSKASLPEIARQLGVAHVITGSVRRVENQVRIQLELRRVRDDALLWSPTYDRVLKDVLGLQSEVAGEVARVLQARQMSGLAGSARLYTTDPEAYDLFLKALKFYWAEKNSALGLAGLNRSCELFSAIVKRDPKFAWAFAFLSTAHAQAWELGGDPGPRAAHATEARRAAEAAAQLDAACGDFALSYFMTRVEGDPVRGLELAQRAARLLPNDVGVHLVIGLALDGLGRYPEVLDVLARANEIDPFESTSLLNRVAALAKLRRVGEFDPMVERFLATGDGEDPRARSLVATFRFALRGEIPTDVKDFPLWVQIDWALRARRWDDARRAVETGLADPELNEVTRCELLRRLAEALRPLGRVKEADGAASAALALAEKLRAADPAEAHATRAVLALSVAGRPDEAITAARWLVQGGTGKDYPQVRRIREIILARVLSRAGRTRESVALLKQLLVLPSGLTVPMLRAEPDWDRLRDDAEFKALLADPKNSAPL